ncbi:MAG: glycosyltransferase family 4 protein [Beijerinckiaceae bacterium]
MIDVAFCIPGDITLPTGGYKYDREVLARLQQHGVNASHLVLPASFPAPTTDALAESERLLAAIPRKTIVLIDGLALGAMPPEMIASLPARTVALVHHPLGLEAGLDPARASWLMANEKAVLKQVRHTIVTSETTKTILIADFDLTRQQITVAEPGTARATRAAGGGGSLHMLAVGAVSERKAYDRLVAALAPLTDHDWHLTIAGSLDRSPEAVSTLCDVIAGCDLAARVTLAGNVDDATLEALYARSDLFVSASLFEGYGMALTEALARGLPIITSDGGAAADTVPDAAAMKVPAGDTMLISHALQTLITDPAKRIRMADTAWAAAALLPTWDDTARDIADTLKTLT